MDALNFAQMEMDQLTNYVKERDSFSTSFSPTLCVTHSCNLSCVYCYQQNRSNKHMTFEIAKQCVDDIFKNIPEGTKRIEISFIGGEPLLEMDLLKQVYEYTTNKYVDDRLVFFATTNGTVLTEKDKKWFKERKKNFVLGLSLDGTPQTHNFNRSNSFEKIDIPFFIKTWPNQGPKMTISQRTINNLAEDIIFIHEQGFRYINGVNFAEGDFDWGDDKELKIFSRQLHKLLDYYTEHVDMNLDQMFGKHIEFCSCDNVDKHKTCGIGTSTMFYDVDGSKYPCSFITPMTFSQQELEAIKKTDFYNQKLFADKDCINNCYIYPICGSCSGANYLVNHSFAKRIKSRCKMNKILCLYIAELHARRILSHKELYSDNTQLYFLIDAIKGIKDNYYQEFKEYLEQ
mgnify:CR=1 FL=1